MGEFVEVGLLKDFSEGKGKCVTINGKDLAMYMHKGKIGAVENTCIHQGGPLCEGELKNGFIVCPWHGWEFDFLTGKAQNKFAGEDAVSFEVKIEGDKVLVATEEQKEGKIVEEQEEKDDDDDGEYLGKWARGSDEFEESLFSIQKIIETGKSMIGPMRTQKKFPSWDTILFKGAQLFRMPLNEDEKVNSITIIGKKAKIPLEIDIPFYVSHMSFGALARESKIALAKGASAMGTIICSGEGGMLPAERESATKYIYELGTACFSHKDSSIKAADAVEIKIGQAAKPGLGGHLPKEKITDEIAQIRGISKDEDSISPGRHTDIESLADLKKEVIHLRDLTGGKPIGIKFAAGHVEKDIEFALGADPDFITVDCRGGGTGAGPTIVKDNTCLPPIFAIHRARKYLDSVKSDVTLCITGGFRDSSDISKALAMGADAVALATLSMIAIGCQQYRICHTGNCPVGIATQNSELRDRFDIEKSKDRFVRLWSVIKDEVKNFARINGRDDVHKLDKTDIFTISNEVSQNTDIEHA